MWRGMVCGAMPAMVHLKWSRNPAGGMAELQPGQPGEQLAQMVAKLTATQWEQAAVSRCQQEELPDRIERGRQRIENLAALIGFWPAPLPPPPAFPDSEGVEEVQTVLAPILTTRVRPGRMQPASAPIPTPWVGAAAARQGPTPVPAPQRRASEQPPGPPLTHAPAQP